MPITFTLAFPFLYLWLRFLCGINFPVGWAREHGYASYSSLLSWTLNKGKHCINAPFNIQCRLIIYYHREGKPFVDQDRSSHTHESYLSSIDPIRQVTYYLKYRAALEDILSEAGTGYILDDLRLAANLNHSLPASTITCLFIHAWVITGHISHDWETWDSFLATFDSLKELVCYGSGPHISMINALHALCRIVPSSDSDNSNDGSEGGQGSQGDLGYTDSVNSTGDIDDNQGDTEEDDIFFDAHNGYEGPILCPHLRRLSFVGDCVVLEDDLAQATAHLRARTQAHTIFDVLELTVLVGADKPRKMEDVNHREEERHWHTKYEEYIESMCHFATKFSLTLQVYQ